MVMEGSYEQKVNESVNVVTAKTSAIGQRTWGIMKDVMAMASQKVDDFAREGSAGWHSSENERNGYYQEFGRQHKDGSSFGDHSYSSGHDGSASDWGQEEKKGGSAKGAPSGDNWAGWDDFKDDGCDNHYSKSTPTPQSGKAGSFWTESGFR